MSRFYSSDGTCIEGLRAARKLSPLPLPSVSTVLSLIVSRGLIEYFKRQMFLAAVTTPRQPGWTDDEHFEACTKSADEHGKDARDKGSDFHSLVQSYNIARKFQKTIPTPTEQWEGQYRSYVGWYEENVAESLAVEEVLMGDGYAGRVDHICRLKGGLVAADDGLIAAVDVKTQSLVKRKSFDHYLSWALQLGAYSGASKNKVDVLLSICVDPSSNTFEVYRWPESPSYYLGLFMGLLSIWQAENNYFPQTVNNQTIHQYANIREMRQVS